MEAYQMGFKFRIYPNKTQQALINKTLGCCRFVFNHFLALRRDDTEIYVWGERVSRQCHGKGAVFTEPRISLL